jgi:hypothetical protein
MQKVNEGKLPLLLRDAEFAVQFKNLSALSVFAVNVFLKLHN